MPEPILRFEGAYRWLSNFYASPFVLVGRTWPTVEHAYQAFKTVDPAARAHVAAAETPGKAKRRGRRVTMRDDWEQVKDQVMLACLRAKFGQNVRLARRLLATGDAHLEEGNDHGDRVWGTVGGVGQNLLGLALMQVRDELVILRGPEPVQQPLPGVR